MVYFTPQFFFLLQRLTLGNHPMKSRKDVFVIRDSHDVRDYVKMCMEEKGNELYESYGYVFNQRDVDMVYAMIETDLLRVGELSKDFDMVRRHMMNEEYVKVAGVELLALLEEICLLYVNKMWPVLIATLKAEGVQFDSLEVPNGKSNPTIH